MELRIKELDKKDSVFNQGVVVVCNGTKATPWFEFHTEKFDIHSIVYILWNAVWYLVQQEVFDPLYNRRNL